MVSDATKGLVVLGAGVAGFLALRGFGSEATEITGGGSAPIDRVRPPFVIGDVFGQNTGFQNPFSIEEGTPISADAGVDTKKEPSSPDPALAINRNLATKAGATSGMSTEFGEVFFKNGEIVGGTDVIGKQSLSPQGAREKLAQSKVTSTTSGATSSSKKRDKAEIASREKQLARGDFGASSGAIARLLSFAKART